MKKKGITLALLLSCTTAAAAPALPSTNSDLRALEQKTRRRHRSRQS